MLELRSIRSWQFDLFHVIFAQTEPRLVLRLYISLFSLVFLSLSSLVGLSPVFMIQLFFLRAFFVRLIYLFLHVAHEDFFDVHVETHEPWLAALTSKRLLAHDALSL